MPPVVVLGNPENRRVAFFQQALADRGEPPARVLAYADLLTGRQNLADEIDGPTILRIESPGENRDVERLLVRLGSDGELGRAGDPTEEDHPGHGEIWHPAAWFRGFERLLIGVQEQLADRPVRWMNRPDEILTAFDKTAAHWRLQEVGVPVPPSFDAPESCDELLARMRATGWSRVFVKLRSGSSASGVVALQTDFDRVIATTSVELVRDSYGVRLFNSLQVRRYSDWADVAAIIDALCREGVHVERWVPKAGFNGRTCDLRVLVIAGAVRHIVVRTSETPLTNLHLGNRRGDVPGLRRQVPSAAWEAMESSCRRAAAAFAGCLYLGIDVAFTPNRRRHFILEVNAFGDLLPGVLDRGESTYAAELTVL